MARPKIHENAAERVAAYREKNARLDVTVTPELAATLQDIADTLDTTKNALINGMIRFSLTNRNWKTQGAWMQPKVKK
jgi:hypothetical protein